MPTVKMINPVTFDEITVDGGQADYWANKGWVQILNTPDGVFWGTPGANPVVARPLIEKLQSATEYAAVAVFGDNSANANTEWFFQLMQWLTLKFPAYSVTHLSWNDTLQFWDNLSQAAGINYQMQTGTAGDAYVDFTGAGTLTTPNVAALQLTGSLDIRVKARANDWTPAANMVLTSKYGAAGQRSWRFYLSTAGNLILEVSTDGTATAAATSSVTTGLTDGTDSWVRATLAASSGAVNFYLSTDGVTWTPLGTQQTIAGSPLTLFNSTQAPEVGGRGGGTEPWSGRIYYVEWRSGLDTAGEPRLILDLDTAIGSAADMSGGTNTFNDYAGRVWTISTSALVFGGAPGIVLFNGSGPATAITYSNDGTRGPKQRAIIAPDIAMINYGLSDGGQTYRTAYKQLADAFIAAWADVGVVAVVQPPKVAPATSVQIKQHAVRNRQIVSLAQSQRYGVIDAFLSFTKDPRGAVALMDGTGVMPNTDGWAAWLDAGKRFFIDVMASDSISEPAINGFQPFVSVKVDRILGSGNWNKPVGARAHYVAILGPGAGGGSGRRGAAGTQCGGGGGGGAGAKAVSWFASSSLTDVVAVSIGTGGAGGAAVTVDDTDGNAGSAGSQSSVFGSYLLAARGQSGGGGGTAAAGGAAGTSAGSVGSGGAGGASGAGAAASSAVAGAGNGGGGGAGITSGGTANTGGVAFPPWDANQTSTSGGAINGSGSDGVDRIIGEALGGYGGGGGGSSVTGPGGAGGKGGKYGAAGGGGGASRNGNNSGKGGDGADGICVVVSVF